MMLLHLFKESQIEMKKKQGGIVVVLSVAIYRCVTDRLSKSISESAPEIKLLGITERQGKDYMKIIKQNP